MEIRTKRLVLAPLGMEYLQSTYEYASDIENTKYMMYLPDESIEEAIEFLEGVEREWSKETPEFYEFAILKDGMHIGAISICLDENHTTGEFGWILNKRYWRQGFISEAAEAILEFGIQKLGLKHFTATCDSENTASYKVMEKLGMRLVSCRGGRKNKSSDEERKEYLYEYIV